MPARVFSVYYNAGQAVPVVSPSSVLADQIGAGTRADHVVADGAATNSATAPRDGVAMVFVPAAAVGVAGTSAARILSGQGVTATANDMIFPGGAIYLFPIKFGERVSVFADGASAAGTYTIVMARGNVGTGNG